MLGIEARIKINEVKYTLVLYLTSLISLKCKTLP